MSNTETAKLTAADFAELTGANLTEWAIGETDTVYVLPDGTVNLVSHGELIADITAGNETAKEVARRALPAGYRVYGTSYPGWVIRCRPDPWSPEDEG